YTAEGREDDLVGALIGTGELTEQEIANIATALLLAGFVTLVNMLALGTYCLLAHPEQLARLRAEPDLVDGAVEELLRYLSIIHIGPTRVASQDLELAGQTIKAGDMVTVSTSAVNRDPEKFEDPDTLDIHRHAQGHTGFGHGIHQCLGQQLARIEMRIGYHELIQRYPGLRLAIPADQVKLRTDMAIYGVHELPVTWE
ncbi:MAG: cytochrome P450, partial [Stackebrandtia sp.]